MREYSLFLELLYSASTDILFFDLFFPWITGDLFIDGKVIPRPQFRFTDRQQQQPSRNRPRARTDRRREPMQSERR